MTAAPSSSLFEPATEPAFSSAVEWLSATMLGSVATGLCIVAIAVVGLTMLSGKLPLRQGGRVLLGCFILFGAPALAGALRNLAIDVPAPAEVPAAPLPPRSPQPSSTFDPYAGASLRQN